MTAIESATPRGRKPASRTVSPAARWLAAATAPWKRSAQRSAALVIADVVPAIGFAAGLGIAMGALAKAAPLDQLHTIGLGPALSMAGPGVALAVGSLALRAALSLVATRAAADAARQTKSGLRQRLSAGLFSGRVSDSQAMAAAVEGIDALDGYMARFAPVRTAAAVSPLLLIAVAAVVSTFTAGIFLFTLLPFVIGMALTGMAAAAESRKQFQAMERLSGLFVDRIRALPTILAFQGEGAETRRMGVAAHELALRTSKVLKVAFLSSAILEFFSALAVALVAVYCGFNLLRILPFPAPDALTLGQAFFLLALAPEVYHPMRRLSAAYHERQAAEAAAPHLEALEEAAPTTERQKRPAPATPPHLAMQSVTIAYPDHAPVLTDFDLDIPAGRSVALVGPSGSGKSSLLHLWLGLTPMTAGQLFADGQPLGPETDLTDWIAYAGQAPMVVPGTLVDNIALAWPQATTRQILEAAAMAGLNGDMGRAIDERGGGLSGGERRRLGLARAFLKPAPVLLLDEPTAHLDAASEKALLPVIARAAKGRTTLIATHSDAVAALADKIVRL